MANERAEAISVANHYFLLADGMVPGLKDYLAKHVELQWFGKVIRGKENIAAFILSDKMESFHTFSDITPISDISCESKGSNRKIKRSMDQNINCETYASNYFCEPLAGPSHRTEVSTTYENVTDCNRKSNANDAVSVHKAACDEFDIDEHMNKLSISTGCDDVNININVNQNEFSANAIAEMGDQSNDHNKNDLCDLLEPEITSQPIVGKIQNINRIKLKEEMAPTIRAINRECDQGDGPVTAEANATKYLEANGEIKFVHINIKTDSASSYHWTKLWRKRFRKQQCRLQISYSLLINSDSPKIARKCCAEENARSARISNLPTEVRHNADKIQKSKLPSLEEAFQASNTLIRDVNYFDGYLRSLNFLDSRKNFIKLFEAEMAQKNPNAHSCVDYANNKLIFDYPSKRTFNVVYQIHKIVYTENRLNPQETADAK